VTQKPVVPRQAANRDVEAIIDYYLAAGAPRAAADFVAELQRSMDRIAAHPALGSPRYALELRIPRIRSWPLRRFPYLVFYVEQRTHVEVWRVLHGQRDVPTWMHATLEDEDPDP
jgi:toxin ParE1/3/4